MDIVDGRCSEPTEMMVMGVEGRLQTDPEPLLLAPRPAQTQERSVQR